MLLVCQIVTAGACGSVKLWDVNVPDGLPVASFGAHREDVSGVDWNLVGKDVFATVGYDAAVHVRIGCGGNAAPSRAPHLRGWCVERGQVWSPLQQAPVASFMDHKATVYGVSWSPYHARVLATASGDGSVGVFDTAGTVPFHAMRVHGCCSCYCSHGTCFVFVCAWRRCGAVFP